MPHILIFIDGIHLIQEGGIVGAIADKGIDGHIAYPERGEVLEKVGSLGGINTIILQSRLHNNACSGDL